MLFGKLTRRGEQKQTGETAPAAMPIAPAMRSSSNSDSRGERPAEARAIHEAEELSMQQIEAAAGEPKNASVAAAAAQVAAKPQSMANETNAHERRAKRRALISAPVRVRSVNATRNAVDDVTTTLNASRISSGISRTRKGRRIMPASWPGVSRSDSKVAAVIAREVARTLRFARQPTKQPNPSLASAA